jgi:hypothetical protein
MASINYALKPTSTLPKSTARGRQPATHTDALVVCGHGARMSKLEKGGALSGEYAYTRCTTALAYLTIFIYLATKPPPQRST